MAAGNLLDIYGQYNQALKNYQNQANAYNTAGQNWSNSVDAYNNSVISDSGAYDPRTGNYTGGGPYTYYNGMTVGRTGSPISTYQTDPTGYNTIYDYNTVTGYDTEGNPTYASSQVPTYSGTNDTQYVDPNTGLASVFASRPGDFTLTAPTAPTAPPPQEVSTTFGQIDPQSLYQTVFGRATPDTTSNDAWALNNISSPFLGSEEGNAYDIGNVNRLNNPESYVPPDALTTGTSIQDINSIISGQQTGNRYY